MEHLQRFGLAGDPFQSEPLARLHYDVPSHRDAWRRLDRAVRMRRGLCLVSGPPGAGKTTVLRRLLDGLEEEVFDASMVVVLRGMADADSVLTRYAKQLGLESPPAERHDLVGEIYERLAIVREDGRHAVLLVDDAQDLGSPEALASLLSLLKLEYEDRRLLTVVLAGTPGLDRALRSDGPMGGALEARVALPPLGPGDVRGYVAHRLEAAGGDPGVLEPDAVAALAELCDGLPGRLNRVADNALFEAFLADRDRVTRADVERAHGDLHGPRNDRHPSPAPRADAAAPGRPLPAPGMAAGEPAPARAAAGDLDAELDAVFEPDDDAPPPPTWAAADGDALPMAQILDD